MYNVEELIAMAAEKRASDVPLIAGLPPKCRIDGEIVNLADVPLSKEDCDTYGLELAGEHIKKIDSIGQLDFAATLAGRRIRVNLFRQQGAISAALRLLSNRIPKLAGTAPGSTPVPKVEQRHYPGNRRDRKRKIYYSGSYLR